MPFLAAKQPSAGAFLYLRLALATGLLFLLSASLGLYALQLPIASTLQHIWLLPFTSSSAWVSALLYALPLGLMAMGLSFAYERRIWNIGAEGQWIAGSLCASLALALMSGWPSSITLLAMLLAGAIGGLLWAAPVAWLKNQKHVDEIVSSLMLSYIAQQVLHYFSQAKSAQQLSICAKNSNGWLAQYPSLLLGALALGLGFYALTWAERRIGGRASAVRITILTSGALAGMAGSLELVCNSTRELPQIGMHLAFGMGFTAILLAHVSRLNRYACLPTAAIAGYYFAGSNAAQSAGSISAGATNVLLGILVCSALVVQSAAQWQAKRKAVQ